jgi:hypothetical protein
MARTAEAGVLQRLARRIAVAAIADQQQLEPPGPVGGRRTIDVSGRDIEGLPPALQQAIEAVAANFVALEPAVGGQPRHRGTHYAGVDIDLPNRATYPVFDKSKQDDGTFSRSDFRYA